MMLSFEDIKKAISGEAQSVEKVFAYYEHYINTLCYNSVYKSFDADEKQELLIALFSAIRTFKIK